MHSSDYEHGPVPPIAGEGAQRGSTRSDITQGPARILALDAPQASRRGAGLVSVVVPVYRSAATLPALHARIAAALEAGGTSFELILVDDASGDTSWEGIRALCRADSRVKGIRLARRSGQHIALMCGLRQAAGERVVTIDDDLQNPPGEIPPLLAALDASGADVVYGVPSHRPVTGPRAWVSELYSRLVAALFGLPRDFRITSFRVLRGEIVRQMLAIPTPYPIVGPLALRVTRRMHAIPVESHARAHGAGHYTPGALMRHFLRGGVLHGLLARPDILRETLITEGASVGGILIVVLFLTGQGSTLGARLALGTVLALSLLGLGLADTVRREHLRERTGQHDWFSPDIIREVGGQGVDR